MASPPMPAPTMNAAGRFRPVHFVFTRVAALDELVQRVLRVPADVADRDPAVLGLVTGDLDVFPAPFLGEFREDDADDGPVIRRVHAQVAVAYRLFDGRQ